MGRVSSYLHGTSGVEQRRLALLNRLVNQGSLRELGLRKGEKVLEVGSGLGHFAREMARQVGRRGRVLGIEQSRRQLLRARSTKSFSRAASLEFRQGDALHLPFEEEEWGSFDVVHARFLLEHLLDPPRAAEQMVRAVRPGGRIILEDDDHDLLRLDPEPEGFWRLWRAYMRVFRLLGNDPLVGRKLTRILLGAGALPRRNTWIFFGSCSGHPDFRAYLENLLGVLRGAREALLSRELIHATDLHKALRELRTWGRRPDASIWYAIAWAEARKPR